MWNMKWNKLNHENMTLYKGIAILIIVIHNFMHLLPGAEEMEFSYVDGLFFNFIRSLIEQPERLFQFSMSFLGHFGVQIFIFLSAYGLTKKYQIKTPSYKKFIYKRFSSIYPSFILAIIFWAIVSPSFQYGLLSPIKVIYWNLESLLYKLSLLSNFIPGEQLRLVGPWWFISLIFQFYLVFPFLFKLISTYGNKGLLLLGLSSVILLILTGGLIGNVTLGYTILGHIPELCIGMYLASNDKKQLNIPILFIVMALIIFILGNIVEHLWYLTHVSFLVILLAIFTYLIPSVARTNYLRHFTLFIGGISMHLFLVNGFMRRPYVNYAIEGNTWYHAIFFGLISLILSIFVAFILSKFEILYRKSILLIKGNINRNI
jgi:peptidoglycan/LPS O-acetylase OafA/YrhL